MTKGFKEFLKLFTAHNGGGAMIYVALTTPVMVGGAALSVDVARLHNLDQQLQSASDAYARAGAAELDGRSDSISRANRAIDSLVSNSQSYAESGDSTVSIASRRYLTGLPANGYDDIPMSLVTTNPNKARYVEVSVAPTRIKTIFPPKISRGLVSLDLDAKATAGFKFGVCGTAPVFVCNPYEGTGLSLFQALEMDSERRRQIKFINPNGGNASFSAGSFGYLDPFGGNGNGVTGASKIKDAIAIDSPPVCFQSDGVYLRPGKIQSVADAFNVRFDIYKGRYSKQQYTSDPAYAPAANVVKGYAKTGKGKGKNKSCSMQPHADALAMPRDTCFDTGTCGTLDGKMGDGNWDFLSYVEVNHNKAKNLNIGGTNYSFNYASRTVTPSTPPSRYDVYRWEIDTDCVPGAQTYGNGNTNTPEEGIPMCHSTGAYTGDIDRRIIHAAVLNCGALSTQYHLGGASTPPLPAEAFIEVFVTEPMGQHDDGNLYGEMVSIVEGSSPVARDTIAMAR